MKFDPVSYAMGTQASGSSSDLSDATATRADILYPKTAYLANGRKNVGTIQSMEAASYTPSTSNQTIAAGKYLAGDQTILGDSNLTAENIKKNISIFGVTGNYTGSFDENKTVHFTDYDGTILYAYTPEEFASLTELPANPIHEGLTAQGWNWDIVEAQEYVAAHGGLDIGQMYITTSGKTEIDIELEEPYLTPYLSLYYAGSTTIEWGDGSSTNVTLSGQRFNSHTYAKSGKYTISIEVKGSYNEIRNGLLFIRDNINDSSTLYKTAIKAIRLGNNMQLGANSFTQCRKMEYITLPNTLTNIGIFEWCYGLSYLVIPNSITSLDKNSCFSRCINLKGISLPNHITTLGQNIFQVCYSLQKIYIPDTVTTIKANAFYQCISLEKIYIPIATSLLGNQIFIHDDNLKELIIDGNITQLPASMALECFSLKKVILPDGLTTIGQSAFNNCYSIINITIPSSVTSIANSAFSGCTSLTSIHFLSSTPPVLASSQVFPTLPPNCIIYVPTGSLEAYTTATNYPSSSTYTYMEE